jgi:hypothetical protein
MDYKDPLPDKKKDEFEEALADALGFILWGLATLEYYGSRTYFPDLPLLLLGYGFERLCKCILVLESVKNKGRLLTVGKLQQYGHNLECLFQQVIHRFPEKVGLEELLQDGDTRAFISLLNDYNQSDRYYYLNKLCSREETYHGETGAPAKKLEDLQDNIWFRNLPREKFGKVLSGHGEFQPIWEGMLKKIERLIRALCQLLTSGALRPVGIEWEKFGDLQHFSDMRDEELGITSYVNWLFPNHRSRTFP